MNMKKTNTSYSPTISAADIYINYINTDDTIEIPRLDDNMDAVDRAINRGDRQPTTDSWKLSVNEQLARIASRGSDIHTRVLSIERNLAGLIKMTEDLRAGPPNI